MGLEFSITYHRGFTITKCVKEHSYFQDISTEFNLERFMVSFIFHSVFTFLCFTNIATLLICCCIAIILFQLSAKLNLFSIWYQKPSESTIPRFSLTKGHDCSKRQLPNFNTLAVSLLQLV